MNSEFDGSFGIASTNNPTTKYYRQKNRIMLELKTVIAKTNKHRNVYRSGVATEFNTYTSTVERTRNGICYTCIFGSQTDFHL